MRGRAYQSIRNTKEVKAMRSHMATHAGADGEEVSDANRRRR